MTERPLLCNQQTVRAILAGLQTQDRRPIKPQPLPSLGWPGLWVVKTDGKPSGMACCNATDWDVRYWCKRWPSAYQVGDHLWVRETWAFWVWHGEIPDEIPETRPSDVHVVYRDTDKYLGPWRPSIHMPRWASRLLLEVTEVRIQRVREISWDDALAEGIRDQPGRSGWYHGPASSWRSPVYAFAELWDELYAKKGLGWDANPWVWASTFRRLP